MIAGPDVPILKQKEIWKGYLGRGFDEGYCLVQYQESDGVAMFKNLRSPSAHKAHEELRAKETKAALDAGKAELKKKPGAEQQQFEEERAARHAADKEPVTTAPEQPEQAVVAPQERQSSAPPIDANGLRLDGPTPEEWVEHGYKMENYPPPGYAKKS